MLFLYRLLFSLALPVLLLRFWLRARRGQDPRGMLAERMGGGAITAPGALWLHAASNGELASARPLIEALLARAPGLKLHITLNSATGREMALGWAQNWGKGRLTAGAAPLDAGWCLRRFLSRHRPAAFLGVENELWPNRILLLRRRGIPVLIAGGRMSARSARRWRKSGLGPKIAAALTAVSAQDPASEAGFRALGLPPERLLPMVNLKTAVPAPRPTWSPGWPRRETILAASTHEGEEEIVLDAFLAARRTCPGLRLILAPRHPRRAGEIAQLIRTRGLGFTLRSAGGEATGPVLLADTMGEMANFYAAAGICFIGGTLADKGGHTPFEPAAYGCAILHGPSTANHRAAFEALDSAGAALPVRSAEDLAQGFLLPQKEQETHARLTREVLAPLGGPAAVSRLADALLPLIAPKN